jgi:hypothetical protein
MSLQRSLQNGRHGEPSDHSTGRWQVGQETVVVIGGRGGGAEAIAQVQSESVKGTSSVVCTGRLPASCHTRKRMLTR